MPTTLKRMTVVLTPDIEVRLDGTKKKAFYNCSHSEMMCTLIVAGLNAMDKKAVKEKDHEKTA